MIIFKNMLNKILLIIFISLIIVGCNREENNERRALSHCADIKFISYANSNPKLFIDPSKVIAETKKRDKKIKEWIKINHYTKNLMAIGKLRAKMNEGEDFVKKYYEWQKQDVSNLNKYHHKVFDDIETFSKDYPFTTVMWELQKKMMKAVPR